MIVMLMMCLMCLVNVMVEMLMVRLVCLVNVMVVMLMVRLVCFRIIVHKWMVCTFFWWVELFRLIVEWVYVCCSYYWLCVVFYYFYHYLLLGYYGQRLDDLLCFGWQIYPGEPAEHSLILAEHYY
jgi:hypothetical protein